MSNLEFARAQARDTKIKLHGPDAFAGMRKAGQLVAEALDLLVDEVRPGVTTEALDELVFDFAMDHGAIPAPLNYRGFPKSICTSINHVVCHGIPGPRALKEGDILNIDVTLHRRRLARRFEPHVRRGQDLPRRRAPARGHLQRADARRRRGEAGRHHRRYRRRHPGLCRSERCSVVRDFCGHGLGRVFHDRPNILHYGEPGEGLQLKPGMLFTIEPMINLGKPPVKILSDGWTAVTRDRSLSAQFEHTVGVTETGCEVFTLSPKGLDRPPLTRQ